jgi:hypothetical protein
MEAVRLCLRSSELIPGSTLCRGFSSEREYIPGLDLKKLRAVRQIAVAFFRNQDDIFKTHAADAEIIKSRFHGDHMSCS